MIVDDKTLLSVPPPPPYSSQSEPSLLPTLPTLPAHILLQIVYATIPQTDAPDEPKVERQRKTLKWIAVSLRLVDRALFTACMHILRSAYLPAYTRLIRTPYTSDPFPSSSISSQRETLVLDRFIALKVRQDVLADDSELHLQREDMYKDLFDLAQPRARIEDLVRDYGTHAGVIWANGVRSPLLLDVEASMSKGTLRRADDKPCTSSTSSVKETPPSPRGLISRTSALLSSLRYRSASASATPPVTPRESAASLPPLPFELISVAFTIRTVGVVLSPPLSSSSSPPLPLASEPSVARAVALAQGRKRTLVQVQRARDEPLEHAARNLVLALGNLPM